MPGQGQSAASVRSANAQRARQDRARARKPAPPRVVAGDAPQYRGMGRAKTYKHTKAYHRQLGQTYREQPLPVRREITRHIKAVPAAKRTAVQNHILAIHRYRMAADRHNLKTLHYLPRIKYADYAYTPHPTSINHMPFESHLKGNWARYDRPILHEADLHKLKAAGFKPDLGEKVSAVVEGPATSAAALAQGLATHPIKTVENTAKSVPLVVAGIGSSLGEMVVHPKKGISDFAKQWASTLATPYPEKVKRVVNQGGFIDAGNASLLLGPAGRAVSGIVLRDAGRASKVLSGGVERVPKKGGAVRFVVGHGVDKAKAARYERLAKKGKPLTPLQHQALEANRRAGRVVAVVPARTKYAIRRAGVAAPRGKAVHALKYAIAHGPVGKMHKELLRLNKNEQKALWFATSLGIRSPEVAAHELPLLKDRILQFRADNNVVPKGYEKKVDIVPQIDELLKNPAKHFTPHLHDTLKRVRPLAETISAEEPQFASGVKEARRRAEQVRHLGLDQGVIPEAARTEWRYTPGEADLAAAVEHAKRPAGPPDIEGTVAGLPVERKLLAAAPEPPVPAGHVRLYRGERGTRVGNVPDWMKSAQGDWFTPDRHMAEGYGHLYYVDVPEHIAHEAAVDGRPGEYILPKAWSTRKQSLNGAAPAAEPSFLPALLDKGIAGPLAHTNGHIPSQGFYEEHAVPPGMRYAPESDAAFHARADAAAAARGLHEPLFFKSERHDAGIPDHASYAVGGARAKSTGKTYKGANLDVGLLDTSRSQFLRGYVNNVKAVHNYDLMDQLVQRNRLTHLSPENAGTDISTLKTRLMQHEPLINRGDVAYINPGIYRRHLQDVESLLNQHATHEEGLDAEASAASQGAILSPRELDAAEAAAARGDENASLMMKTKGWYAVPTTALRELEHELKAGTKAGRLLDIAKGRSSQAILLTLNAPWLAYQALSEGGVTAMATRGRALNPANWAGTVKWWKGMTHQQRREVASSLGLGTTGMDTQGVAHLGATTNAGFVNWYRGMKQADFWHTSRKPLAGHSISQLSPIKLMAAADRGKTNVTRLLAAHSELKRAAVADLAEGLAAHDKAVTKLMNVFKMPVHQQFEHLTKEDPGLLEHTADTVSKWLGDWTTMTHAERKVANRAIMFYPYVRYSLRLLFYTMPVDHPAMTAVLGEMGQLQVDEYRQIFGSDDLPWELGKVYWGPDGHMKSMDFSRANPIMNAALTAGSHLGSTSSNVPGAIIGTLPPYAQWLADQLTGVNTFKARTLRLHGDTDPAYRKPYDISLADHAKLAISELQSLFYPAREAMQRLHPESQSDESSLLFPTPMTYKPASSFKGNSLQSQIGRAQANEANTQERFNKDTAGGIGDVLLGPLRPTPTRDLQASKARRYIKGLKKKQNAEAAARKRYRDTHGGKNPPRPKSPFGGGGKRSPFS